MDTNLIGELCGRLRGTMSDTIYGKVLDLLLSAVRDPEPTLNQKVDKLISKHFETAKKSLQFAFDVPASDREEFIKAARSEFIAASTVEIPKTAAHANFFAGACFDLLGQTAAATRCYVDAYESGLAFEKLCVKSAERKKLLGNEAGKVAAGAVALGPWVAGILVGIAVPVAGIAAFGIGLATVLAGWAAGAKALVHAEKLIDRLGLQVIEDWHQGFLLPLARLLRVRGYNGALNDVLALRLGER